MGMVVVVSMLTAICMDVCMYFVHGRRYQVRCLREPGGMHPLSNFLCDSLSLMYEVEILPKYEK